MKVASSVPSCFSPALFKASASFVAKTLSTVSDSSLDA